MRKLTWVVSFLLFITLPVLSSEVRYVTAGGTITEIVFALDRGERVVAVDQSSSYPAQISELPVVGYYRDLAAEGVLSTQLTHLLALEGSGREQALQQIKSAGVTVNIYPKPTSIDGLFNLIKTIARDIDAQAQGEKLIASITAALPQPQPATGKRGLFLISAGERGLIAAGQQTVPQLLFDYIGVTNTATHDGFKGIGIEALAVSQPDFIVAPEHVVAGSGGKQAFCAQPSLALIEAAQTCQLLVMDSLLSLGMTPRIEQAIATLRHFASQL